MRKKIIGIIAVIILVVVSYFTYSTVRKITTPEKVHYHAGFVVFKDDKKIDFSDFKYMRIKPCTEDEEHEDSDEDIQTEKAHLHDFVGDVVHVEEKNAHWRDLFSNINHKIDYSKAVAFINGKKVSQFENRKIQPDESLIILIGNNKSTHLQDAVSKSYINEKADKGEDC
ncbi:MAG: hypothetical protein AAB675_00925 [Patescibacteria group bacterium]